MTQSNRDLEDIAKKLKLPLYTVVSKDELKDVKKKSGEYAIIINLQDDYNSKGVDLSGTHWTALYVEGRHAVYFDPIGFIPPADVQLWMYPFKPYIYSGQQVQDEKKEFCGMYCLHFIQFMTQNKQIKDLTQRLQSFLKLYLTDDKELPENEILLHKYLRF